MRCKLNPRLSEVSVVTFCTLAGGVPGAIRVLTVSWPEAPLDSEKVPVQLQVRSTWPSPHPPGVRERVGGTAKPLELPFRGLDGLAGSTRSSPGGRQSTI